MKKRYEGRITKEGNITAYVATEEEVVNSRKTLEKMIIALKVRFPEMDFTKLSNEYFMYSDEHKTYGCVDYNKELEKIKRLECSKDRVSWLGFPIGFFIHVSTNPNDDSPEQAISLTANLHAEVIKYRHHQSYTEDIVSFYSYRNIGKERDIDAQIKDLVEEVYKAFNVEFNNIKVIK